MNDPSRAETAANPVLLRTVGIAVALGVVATCTTATVPATAAIALAIGLVAWAERLQQPPPRQVHDPAPIVWPLPIRIAIALGVLLCMGSTYAVASDSALWIQHLPWALALAAFSGAAAAITAPPTQRYDRFDYRALAILAFACLGMFFVQLTTIPPEVHGDEAETALDALRLLEEPDRGLFSTSWFGLPILHAGPTALGFLLFGPNLLGLRMASALLATASVFLLFSIVRRLADTRLALLSGLVLAGQRYFIHLARSGYHYVDTPFLTLLALWLMIRLWQDRRASSAIWCGIALGFSVHTYYASRLVPLLIAATTFFFAARAPRGQRQRYVWELGLVTVIALALAAPLFAHFADHLDELWGRTQETSLFNPESRTHLAHGYGTSSLAEMFQIQLRQALSIFHFAADTSVQYGYQAPMLDVLGRALMLVGLGGLVGWAGSPLGWLCVLWILPPLILGGALTIDTPFYPRMSGVVPFAAIAIAAGVVRTSQTIVALFRPPNRPRARAAYVAAALVAALLAINVDSYFRDYAPNHRHSPMRDISEWIREQGRGAKTYLFDQRNLVSIYHGTISFLAGSFAREDVDDIPAFLADQSIVGQRSRFVIMDGSEAVLPRLEQKFGPLEVEKHVDAYDQPRFYTARPRGAGSEGLEPRPAKVPVGKALPWLALVTAMAAITAFAAWRQRRQGPKAAAPGAPHDDPPPNETSPVPVLRPSPAVVAVALALIVAIGVGLRFVQLEQLPSGFYCDEAGNIYNTASILRTGRDESGAEWPLYIWSFDTSYKNPVFIYAAAIPVALFGPGPFAARATAAAFGTIAVVAIFFLGRAIAGNVAGLFAALFLAIIPWHLHFSRIAFELISFPALFTIGAVGLVAFANGRRSLSWAALALGASLYTYVPAKLFVPLFVATFAWLFRRELWQRRRESIVGGALLLAVALPTVVFDLSNQDRSSRYLRGTTFVTADMGITDIAAQLGANYTHFYSPSFLFHRGDRILRHAVQGHGELYSAMAPLLLIGLVAVVVEPSRKKGLVLVWLALYPLAAAFIRREIPSASRAIIGAPAFCLLAAFGCDWLWRRIPALGSKKLRAGVLSATALAGLAIVLAAQTIQYWRLYSETYPLYTARHYIGFQYGHEQVVDYFLDHYDDYDRFLLSTSLSNQPEIFLRLFAGLQQPPSDQPPPFEMPAKMDRATPSELKNYRGDRLLFAAVPQDLLYFADYEVLEKIQAPDGSSAFLLTEVREPKDFIHAWMVAGPYPSAETPPPPEFDPASPPATAPGGRPWQRYQLRLAQNLLDHLYGEETDDACAWAINFVYSEYPQTVDVFAGFDDAGEIWVNGERIELRDEDNPFQTWVDTANGSIDLREGRNRIAVKTCDIVGGWVFYFRLAGKDGKKVPHTQWEYVFEEGF